MTRTLFQKALDDYYVARHSKDAERLAATEDAVRSAAAGLQDPKSGLEPVGLLRDLCSEEWHDCACDVHEAARYYLAAIDRRRTLA